MQDLLRTIRKKITEGTTIEIDCYIPVATKHTFAEAVACVSEQFRLRSSKTDTAHQPKSPPRTTALTDADAREQQRFIVMEVGTNTRDKLIQLERNLHFATQMHWHKCFPSKKIPTFDAKIESEYMKTMANLVFAAIIAVSDQEYGINTLKEVLQLDSFPHLRMLHNRNKLWILDHPRASGLYVDLALRNEKRVEEIAQLALRNETRVQEITAKMATIGTRQAKLESRVGDIQESIRDVTKSLASVDNNLAKLTNLVLFLLVWLIVLTMGR